MSYHICDLKVKDLLKYITTMVKNAPYMSNLIFDKMVKAISSNMGAEFSYKLCQEVCKLKQKYKKAEFLQC